MALRCLKLPGSPQLLLTVVRRRRFVSDVTASVVPGQSVSFDQLKAGTCLLAMWFVNCFVVQ
jgi:hypothetical protein